MENKRKDNAPCPARKPADSHTAADKPCPELSGYIERAVAGDKESLETVISSVRDLVFNLSLRMLGTFPDAEDATQDILLKIITHLSSFRKESAFSTWVFRIAVNHLKDYKKHMFANYPLSFEFYGNDIENGKVQDIPDLTQNVEQELLEEELKMACTNVMLQCLDTESRCIFVLGTMFQVDSRIAGSLLGMTPEAYRQRLSRIRRKVADFLETYCGEYGSGSCRCKNRINYAIQNHRINPACLDYTAAAELPAGDLYQVKEAMEDIDGLAAKFSFCKTYESPENLKQFVQEFLSSATMSVVKGS
ncbi:sigma-70 family RNA polymerase sigma factor [Lachnospiraceae bacterium A2]|nr:sigma-70 family RNA polymerase sigma factor [Lachnospiraceae bacterium A2]